jgi:hypothetical protein
VKVFSCIARASRGLVAAGLLLGTLLVQPTLASAASLTAAPGQSVNVSTALTLGQTLNSANVVLFLVSSSGTYNGLHVNTVANFTVGKSTTVSAKFSLPASLAAGTYTISAGIYGHDWTQLHWLSNVFSFQVTKVVASLPSTSTGTAELSWPAPTDNTDGSVLADLAGYKIYYGTSANNLTQSIKVTNPGLTAYTVSDLAPGAWYFVVTAYSSAGVESDRSAVVGTNL